MKTLSTLSLLTVAALFGGCVAVPAGSPYYGYDSAYYGSDATYSAPAAPAYYPAPAAYYPAPVYYGAPGYYGPSYYGPSVSLGFVARGGGGWHGGHGYRGGWRGGDRGHR